MEEAMRNTFGLALCFWFWCLQPASPQREAGINGNHLHPGSLPAEGPATIVHRVGEQGNTFYTQGMSLLRDSSSGYWHWTAEGEKKTPPTEGLPPLAIPRRDLRPSSTAWERGEDLLLPEGGRVGQRVLRPHPQESQQPLTPHHTTRSSFDPTRDHFNGGVLA